MSKRYLTLLCATCAIILVVTPIHANNDKSQGNHGIIIDDKARENADTYWTPERLKAAQPMPMPKIDKDTFKKMRKSGHAGKLKQDKPQGVPGYVSSPDSQSNGVIPPPVDLPIKVDISKYPYNTAGKLFFTHGGKDYICTAQFSGDYNMLLTAAHCVRNHETGEYYKNFKFMRGFDNGGGTKYLPGCVATKSAWVTGDGSYEDKFDYAWIQTTTDSSVGYLGWWTLLLADRWESIGYPSNYNNAKELYGVTGPKGNITSGIAQMEGNPFKEGSSGGAWIGQLAGKKGYYAIGLNSYSLWNCVDCFAMYGPYFDYNFYYLYWYVHGGCKGTPPQVPAVQ